MALTRRTGGGFGANKAHWGGGGGGANEAHGGGGDLALARRLGGGGGVGANEAHGGGLAPARRLGWGVALPRRTGGWR